MSPEPTQEPIQENLTVSNVILDARAANDEEDSDDEDMSMAGYVPLSQVSTDADPILGEEEVANKAYLHSLRQRTSRISSTFCFYSRMTNGYLDLVNLVKRRLLKQLKLSR